MGSEGSVVRAARHVKRFLLLYSVLAIAVGIAVGCRYEVFFRTHKLLVRNLIVSLAMLTIYPSMIQLKVERLGVAARKARAIVLSMLMIFVLSPLLAMAFSSAVPNAEVAVGYVVSNVVPASSASIGYVLLVDGDVELATVLAVFSLFGSLIAVPGYLSVYSSASSVKVPLDKVMRALMYTLVIPFILGQITRHLAVRHEVSKRLEHHRRKAKKRGDLVEELEEEIRTLKKELIRSLETSLKPHLSLATMLFMLVLIGVLSASRAFMMVSLPHLTLTVIGLQAMMLFILLGIITAVDKALRLSYEEHEAIAFISATKNQSVAAAIAVMSLGPGAALVPALVPAIQAPVAIAYVHASPTLKRIFR